jgi:ABC-2 type transport system permease protein
MLRKETGTWWGTRKWWVQSLVWLLLVNGVIGFILWAIPLIEPMAVPQGADAVPTFMAMIGVGSTLGVLILTQSIIVREKQMGTAAWILSNPVTRVAFVLAKLVGHAIGCLAIIILLQGLVAYVQFSLRDAVLWPALPLAAAMGLQALNLLFYLTLAVMLGTLFRGRGPVLGIAFTFYFAQEILAQLESIVRYVPPYMPAKLPQMAVAVALGQPLPSVKPILSVTVACLLFVVVALWRFSREEF